MAKTSSKGRKYAGLLRSVGRVGKTEKEGEPVKTHRRKRETGKTKGSGKKQKKDGRNEAVTKRRTRSQKTKEIKDDELEAVEETVKPKDEPDEPVQVEESNSDNGHMGKAEEGDSDTGQMSHGCFYCPVFYMKIAHLVSHIDSSHAEYTRKKKCDYGSKRQKRAYRCFYCTDRYMEGFVSMRRHLYGHHRDKLSEEELVRLGFFRCPEEQCGRWFAAAPLLRSHRENKHTPWTIDQARSREAPGPFGKVSSQFHGRTRALECSEECAAMVKRGDLFTCNYCQKKFRYHSPMVLHESAHETKKYKESIEEAKDGTGEPQDGSTKPAEDGADESSDLMPKCPICSKILCSFGYIKSHIDTVHKRIKRFLCDICAKGFTSSTTLVRHKMAAHSTENSKPYSRCGKIGGYHCEKCGLKYRSFGSWKMHKLWHAGQVPKLPCCYCGKVFKTQGHRQAHERIHTGLRKYECHICEKKFTHEGTLHNHLYRYNVHGIKENKRKRKPRIPPVTVEDEAHNSSFLEAYAGSITVKHESKVTTTDGQTTDGHPTDGHPTDGQAADGQLTDRQLTDGQSTLAGEGEHVDNIDTKHEVEFVCSQGGPTTTVPHVTIVQQHGVPGILAHVTPVQQQEGFNIQLVLPADGSKEEVPDVEMQCEIVCSTEDNSSYHGNNHHDETGAESVPTGSSGVNDAGFTDRQCVNADINDLQDNIKTEAPSGVNEEGTDGQCVNSDSLQNYPVEFGVTVAPDVVESILS